MKKMLLLLIIVFGITAQPKNFNGWLDTLAIREKVEEDSTRYSSAIRLSAYEDIRVLVKCDDSTSVGFASDSIDFYYGYQTGSLVLDSAGAMDTAWDNKIFIDSMQVDSFGVENIDYCDSSGNMVRRWRTADTTNLAGYAYQSRWFVPEWDVLLRFWATGLDGNLTGEELDLFFQILRRNHVKVGP